MKVNHSPVLHVTLPTYVDDVFLYNFFFNINLICTVMCVSVAIRVHVFTESAILIQSVVEILKSEILFTI